MVRVGWPSIRCNFGVLSELHGNGRPGVRIEHIDIHFRHSVHVGGGDDGGAVGVGEVEAVAEGGGGEDQGHHWAGRGDADVVEQGAGMIGGGPGAVHVDVGDAAGQGEMFLVEVGHALGVDELSEGDAGEHAQGAGLGNSDALLLVILAGDDFHEALGVAKVGGAADDVGEAEEQAECFGNLTA